MLKVILICFFIIFISLPLFAQSVDTAWVRRYNGPANSEDLADGIAIDDSNNVYVTGWSRGVGTSDDNVTIKYRSNGDTAWVRRYNTPGNSFDQAEALGMEASGNIYVSGSMGMDASGNIYVWGEGVIIKYNPNGDTAWVRTQIGNALSVDNSGNVYLTGGGENGCLTAKYYTNGDTAWVRRYKNPGTLIDYGFAIAVDHSGNIYVTGNTRRDYLTLKYYPNGDTAWVRIYYILDTLLNMATDISIDRAGDVYVTGISSPKENDYDYVTIKYYPDGDTAWVRIYDGPINFWDFSRIAIDDSDNCFVTGGSGLDFVTIKYYPNGDTAWVRKYDGTYNIARDIAVDTSGNAYITGISHGDYLTIKYYANGGLAWVRRYDGPGSSTDEPTAIVVGTDGNVYVTGYSYGSGSLRDYATIKYVTPPPEPTNDLSVALWGDGRARPGFFKGYIVSYENWSTEEAENVSLSVTLPKEVQYTSCSPTCTVNGKNVNWDLGTVGELSGGSTNLAFYIPTSVPAGTILKGTAKITTTSKDKNQRNNRSDEQEEVVNSYDPNDKEAQPWGGGTAKYVMPDQALRYTIFFENDSSATAEAIYIDIVDTLDANLDWSTLEIGPMSHPDTCYANFDDLTGILTWHCDSIMLPPNHNPPEGESFVSFWIKPDSALPSGTQIKNRAYIKFDYNPWIAAPDSGAVIRTIGKFGDANADGQVTVSDVIYLVNYLFKGGSEPVPFEAGDVNCDGSITVSDVVYLINYLFKGGPNPPC